MLKADLMDVPERWAPVDLASFARRCLEAGLGRYDVEQLTGWLERGQAGARLLPYRSYPQFLYP